VIVAFALALLQAPEWTARPARPTVGDTVRVSATIPVSPGWRLRAGKVEPTERLEALADPTLVRAADGWTVTYLLAAWTPGRHVVIMPPLWRLGPEGELDSLPGGTVTLDLRSVLSDSGTTPPAPRPLIAPLRGGRRDPLPLAAGMLLATLTLVGATAWRRRAPRRLPDPPPPELLPEVPDARWLGAGEPKAVAARAAHRLRSAIAAAIPDAAEALATAECLAAVERLRPRAPLRDLRDVLVALDQVEFSSAHGADVAALAVRARALAQEFST